jgi:hypothetical protein
MNAQTSAVTIALTEKVAVKTYRRKAPSVPKKSEVESKTFTRRKRIEETEMSLADGIV